MELPSTIAQRATMTSIHPKTRPASLGGAAGPCSTLLLNFHPAPAGSRTIAALSAAAGQVPGVVVREVATLQRSGALDSAAEAAELLAADRLVMLFPVQWYAPPATFKVWADDVLTRMYFDRYETEGRLMEGKPLLVCATVGSVAEAYGPDGRSLYSLEELLRPLEAMAHRCRFRWSPPFLLYRAGRLTQAELDDACEAFVGRLRPRRTFSGMARDRCRGFSDYSTAGRSPAAA
jgi:putative NADPH-quinone reductase